MGLAVAATCPRRGVRKWLSSSRHVGGGGGGRGHLPSPGGTQVGLAVAATRPRRGVRKWLSSSRHVGGGGGERGHLPSPGGTQVGLAVAATCPRWGVRKWLSSSCGARFCTYSDAPAAWSETDAHGCCRGCMHHLDAAWRVNRVSIQVVEERVWGLATNQ